MAELIRVDNNVQGYLQIIELLLSKGKRQPSRNGETLEVEDLTIEVGDSSFMSPQGVRPNYNQAIGYVEGLQLIAGISDSALTAQIQPNFRNYMEDADAQFWGAYGPRLREQLPVTAERLRKDPDTRQAVATLWDPELDGAGGKKDHPCTNRFSFRVRDGALNMSVDMRSCDAWWGWPYDAVQFGMVHHTMAGVLDLEVGTYTHRADSFHLYEPHWQAARAMLEAAGPELAVSETARDGALLTPLFVGNTWEEARLRAFTCYRVVTQTLPFGALEYHEEREIATTLLERRAVTLGQVLPR